MSKRKHANAAAKQKAYRERHRNAPKGISPRSATGNESVTVVKASVSAVDVLRQARAGVRDGRDKIITISKPPCGPWKVRILNAYADDEQV